VGRVAVNMTAGALGYPRKRFVGLTALAAVTWAAYGTAVGVGAGVWLEEHPLIAVVAGVVVGTVVGLLIDWVLRRWIGVGRAPASPADDDTAVAPRAGTTEPTAPPAPRPGAADRPAPAPRVATPAGAGSARRVRPGGSATAAPGTATAAPDPGD
jgi:membrane-associated protein